MVDEVVEVVDDKTLDARMTDTLASTLKEITSREPEVLEAEAPAVEAAETVPTGTDERPRGPDGKFLPKESKTESAAPAKAEKAHTPPEAAAPAQAAAEPDQPLVAPGGQPIDINRAPSSWKPAAKAVWANLPQEVRAEIYRREGDFHVGNKPLKENADFGQRMRSVIEPFAQLIQAEGGSPEKSVENYFRTAATLRQGTREQKIQTLFALDQQFGAGLQDHFQQSVMKEVSRITGQPSQVQQQPQVFRDERVDQLLAYHQRQESERMASEQKASSQATEKFISAKDPKGQPLYPFVDNVIDDMSARVASIRQANPGLGHEEVLKQAYEAAVWANPETRDVLIKQQQAAAIQPVEKLQKVEKAKAASAGNMPKRGSLPATAPAGKFNTPEGDEAIRATYRQLTG